MMRFSFNIEQALDNNFIAGCLSRQLDPPKNHLALEVEKKKGMVDRQHQLSDFSREKLRQISNERIMEGKKEHNKKLLQEYAKGEIQRRKNLNLLGVFTEKVKKIEQNSSKCKLQLQEYQKMLGMRLGTRKVASKNSFYMTH